MYQTLDSFPGNKLLIHEWVFRCLEFETFNSNKIKLPCLDLISNFMEKQLSFSYHSYENWRQTELIPKDVQEKLEALLETAYAPYSNYPVSSVVIMESGDQVVGSNQENAAYPDGLCAERVSVLAAKAAYPDQRIAAVYIMTAEDQRSPAAPCGSCRQVLHEAELRQTDPFDVYLLNKTNVALEFKGVQGLLPFSFTLPK